MIARNSNRDGVVRRLHHLGGLVLVALVVLAFPASTFAHEITKVDVDCEGQTIEVSGKLFAELGPIEVTVEGPPGSDYSETFLVETNDEWTKTLPLGPNGDYSIDWPESGDFGPVTFTVECEAAPAEETPSPTPTARVRPDTGGPTLPPTNMLADATSAPAGATWSLLWVVMIGLLTVCLALIVPAAKRR